MIDSENHISLDGVKYRLDEAAEGEHYIRAGEPLRPPNAQVVQGETGQKFQMRPDTLLWSITDWSGGEGQYKFDQREPNRHWELTGVDVFSRPGRVRPGPRLDTVAIPTDTNGNYGGAWAPAGTDLYFVGYDRVYTYVISTDTWTQKGDTAGFECEGSSAVADDDFIWWSDGTRLVKYTQAGDTVAYIAAAATASGTNQMPVALLNENVYWVNHYDGTVQEVDRTSDAEIEIDNWGEIATDSSVVAGNGRVYVGYNSTDNNAAIIREITPTTAAGPGYGAEVLRLIGFDIESLWFHGGTLYFSGSYSDGTAFANNAVMYLLPDGTYGSLGKSERQAPFRGDKLGGRLLSSFGITQSVDESLDASAGWPGLMELDSVTGGVACLTYSETGGGASASYARGQVVNFGGSLLLSHYSTDTTNGILTPFVTSPTDYIEEALVISPWHDFNLASTKVLNSITLSTEALPADWTIDTYYAVDGSATWTAGTQMTTDGDTTNISIISSGGATKEFNTLAIKVVMKYTGGGVATTAPVLLGVDVRCSVAEKQPVWQLLVSLADDHSHRVGANDGAAKITALNALSDAKSVVTFLDGYGNRKTGQYTTHQVIVDSVTSILTKPGEGFAQVTLREVT